MRKRSFLWRIPLCAQRQSVKVKDTMEALAIGICGLSIELFGANTSRILL